VFERIETRRVRDGHETKTVSSLYLFLDFRTAIKVRLYYDWISDCIWVLKIDFWNEKVFFFNVWLVCNIGEHLRFKKKNKTFRLLINFKELEFYSYSKILQ
jgi:hypothetical protein